jgi:predicted nucleic acid-binding protein
MSVAGLTRWAVDTSVAVAALDEAHAAHVECRRAATSRRPALAGHAAFETYSVLTRLHGPLSIAAPAAAEALALAFPDRCWLGARQQAQLAARLGTVGITGGMVYDALVGEAARQDGRVLLTRDLRASRTYELLGVRYELVGP